MSPEWINHIEAEKQKEYFFKLKDFVTKRRQENNVLPAANEIFNAFLLCPWDSLKVVILSQDPYPDSQHAHGLAFSSQSQTTPYSLQNIFQEIFTDIFNGNTGGVDVFQHNNLTQWARQGVLLLNSCLTVDQGKPGSHQNKGWEIFTENTIKYINDRHDYRIVFMLWGAQAKSYSPLINQDKHLVLTADHPASVRHRPNAWFGNKHFSQANNFISQTYQNLRAPIGWGIFSKNNNL